MNVLSAFIIGIPVGAFIGIVALTSFVAVAWWRHTIRYYFGYGW